MFQTQVDESSFHFLRRHNLSHESATLSDFPLGAGDSSYIRPYRHDDQLHSLHPALLHRKLEKAEVTNDDSSVSESAIVSVI